MIEPNVCLLNDSFPPLIDGVANAVVNYAKILNAGEGKAVVVTPSNPAANDSDFSFPVIRYPSLNTTRVFGYRAGSPLSSRVPAKLKKSGVNLLHSHCPIMSTLLARSLRNIIKAPIVLTYHTKFDVDIANAVRGKLLQSGALKIIVQNIEACDEVWVVSRGAGDNLRSLGYSGECMVMPNGVDYPSGRVDPAVSDKLKASLTQNEDIPLFLYVGRMMWYKGLRITADALALLKAENKRFRAVFVGDGAECGEIKAYFSSLGLDECCVFVGAEHDREPLRAYYCAADAFVFPSSYDTNGLVVREAAACSLPSVLVRGSCAAEDAVDGESAYLIDENAESLKAALSLICENRESAKKTGEGANKSLYISWEESVSRARQRYNVVLERYRAGLYPEHTGLSDDIFRLTGELMRAGALIYSARDRIIDTGRAGISKISGRKK